MGMIILLEKAQQIETQVVPACSRSRNDAALDIDFLMYNFIMSCTSDDD